jgi:hypothetical protein
MAGCAVSPLSDPNPNSFSEGYPANSTSFVNAGDLSFSRKLEATACRSIRDNGGRNFSRSSCGDSVEAWGESKEVHVESCSKHAGQKGVDAMEIIFLLGS